MSNRGVDAPKYEAIHSSTDQVEMLAYDLAVELEQADLDRNDYVTVNRAKLRAIAERVIARTPAPHELVEQAFRDGIAYATLCEVTDVDLAWSQSRAHDDMRAALNAAASIPAGRGVEAEGRPVSFVWTDDMYTAFNAIQAMKSHPQPQELLAVWDALHGAAEYAASPAPLPVEEQEPVAYVAEDGTLLAGKPEVLRRMFHHMPEPPVGQKLIPLYALSPNLALEAEVERLREALKPFGTYLDQMPDLDNKGRPLPDEEGMGWVYLTIADFRRARAALGDTP